MPAADEHQVVGSAIEPVGQPGQVVEQVLRREPDLLVGGPKHLGHSGNHGAVVDSVRMLLEFRQGQPVGILAVPVAERGGAQRQVEHALRATVVVVLADLGTVEPLGEAQVIEPAVVERSDVDLLGRSAGAQPGQPDQDLPFLRRIWVFAREHRRRVPGEAVDRGTQQQVGGMCLLERRGTRQDDVGMPGGLVEPQVHRDHRVQLRQRLIELVAARRGQDGVARHGDQCLQLPFARRDDLFEHARHRNLAHYLFGPADPGAVAAEVGRAVLQAGDRLAGDGPCCRGGEHGATGSVEVSGDDVDDVDQPTGQAAELLVAGTYPAVDHRPWRGCQFPGQSANPLRTDTCCGSNSFGRPLGDHLSQGRYAVEVAFQLTEVDQPLVEDCVNDTQQQRGVGTGRDRQPLVSLGSGLGPHRVDDDNLAALTDSADDAHHVGGGQERALRCRGVGAHHHQQVGALQIGCREGPPTAVHQVRRQVLRPLVDGAG